MKLLNQPEQLLKNVRSVVRDIWDPINLGGDGPGDEYDSYAPRLVSVLQNPEVSEPGIADVLRRLERDAMGLTLGTSSMVRAARALLCLREAHRRDTGNLVRQVMSVDGSSCLWIWQRSDGLFSYEHVVLQHEHDENGV